MPNSNAVFKLNCNFVDGFGAAKTMPLVQVSAPYQSPIESAIDVPDTTAAGTEYAVPFGSIGVEATGLLVKNDLPNDLLVKINEPLSATGTLSSGAADINLANVAGDELAVQLVTSHGTPGVLSVKRKSDSQVTVQSWLSGTGIQASDTSDVKVINRAKGYQHRLAPGGVIACAAPSPTGATGQAGTPITSAKVMTTYAQAGAGKIGVLAFGDPV